MSALIDEFKRDHAKIIDMLNEVKKLGILSKEGQARLMSIKVHLQAHLKKEDVTFYPLLYKVAEENEKLKSTLDLFAMDMENVSEIVREFFEKYSEGFSGIKPEELQEDFENLLAALKKRISNEEESLYEEYEILDKPDM